MVFKLFLILQIIKTPMDSSVLSAASADAKVEEAIKNVAAYSRIASAAVEKFKQAKKNLKLLEKQAKESRKKETASLKKPKSNSQIAYQLFGDDLRKNGEKISMKRQGELWKTADQPFWLLKVHALQTRQNV